MHYNPIMILLLTTMATLAIYEYHIMPKWWYKLLKYKPFSCMTCANFWMATLTAILFGEYAMAILIGLASVGLTITIKNWINR